MTSLRMLSGFNGILREPWSGCCAAMFNSTYDFMGLNADLTTAKGSRKRVWFCTYDTLLLNKCETDERLNY